MSTDTTFPGSNETSPSVGLAVFAIPHRALIRVLALSHRNKLDAGPLVSHLAGEFPGPYGDRLRRLAILLSTGVPVADALDQTPGLLDRPTIAALKLADDRKDLQATYQAMLQETVTYDADDALNNTGKELSLLVFIFILLSLLIAFLITFVVPQITEIFEDFALELPVPFTVLIAVSGYLPLVFLAALGIICAFLALQGPTVWITAERWINPLASRERIVPHSASMLSILALIIQRNQPWAASLGVLEQSFSRSRVGKRLSQVRHQLELGAEPWSALAGAGLLSDIEAGALAAVNDPLTQVWMLRWMAQVRERRQALRTHLAARAMSIAGVAIFGIIVGWTVISVFMVLCSLIKGLA